MGRDWEDTLANRAELGYDTYGQSLASLRHRIDYFRATGREGQGSLPLELPGFFDDQETCYATYH